MRPLNVPSGNESFRPFFWVDEQARVLDWPETTARALHRPAREALGRPCWEVLAANGRKTPAPCSNCVLSPPGSTRQGCGCAVLPLRGPPHETLVWAPFSRIARGPSADARLESLSIRGALATRLDSIESALDGLRCALAADDCELFLLDPSGTEVVLVDCEGADRNAFLEQMRMPLGAGYPGTVTLQQKPLFTNRFQHDRLVLRQTVKRCGIHSYLGVPLFEGGQILGFLGLGWRNESVPMRWALRMVDGLQDLVAVALRNRPLPTGQVVAAAPALAIRCFGSFEILRNGRKLGPEAFSRRKALELLKILVLRRGAPAHRDELAELLWPGIASRSGANRLHGVINALRSALEDERRDRRFGYILCRGDHYLLNTEAPHSIDLYEFTDLVAMARSAQRRGTAQAALHAYDKAIALYRGDLFNDDVAFESFDAQRLQLRHSYLDAVRAVAEAKLRMRRDDEALHALRQALALEPAAVDLQEALITRLAQIGRLAEARQQYESCRLALRRNLDMDPPLRTRALEKLLF